MQLLVLISWNLVYIFIYAYMLIYANILKSLDCLANLYVDTYLSAL